MSDALFEVTPTAEQCFAAGHLLQMIASGGDTCPNCGAHWASAEASTADRACTELAIPHRPVAYMTGAYPEGEPNIEDVCPICWEYWPCLIAWLSGLEQLEELTTPPVPHDGYCEEPPF
jgi:hypothetical protein